MFFQSALLFQIIKVKQKTPQGVYPSKKRGTWKSNMLENTVSICFEDQAQGEGGSVFNASKLRGVGGRGRGINRGRRGRGLFYEKGGPSQQSTESGKPRELPQSEPRNMAKGGETI